MPTEGSARMTQVRTLKPCPERERLESQRRISPSFPFLRSLARPIAGVCDCFDTYSSSDGYASAGLRGDCGYPEISVTACPGELSCSGHGICQGYPTYVRFVYGDYYPD